MARAAGAGERRSGRDTEPVRTQSRAARAELLLRRERRFAADVVEHLAGLQSQVPNPPYFALWARVHGFDPAHLATLLTERIAVRATAMRGTIHLLSAADYRRFRGLFQPMLTRSLAGSP